ncbi:phosphotransacetylase family protein [Ancylothrix sp. C2]|uniref:phosphotransacetylase family protein n=1 Tax=Ancylothrix sp. D3o TaxID=2953691 RepID=UPI0021BA5B96|nr:phosphotransacetylase family protein [Ancylothrix sp. D3o]MCT7952204.1 phosphotransacetylase family protein [Ancylothrix sp. D3o]
MAKSAKCLLIGSTEAYSGKSATIVGIAHHLHSKGIEIAYGKPLGTCLSQKENGVDEDVRFISKTLDLPENRLISPLAFLDEATISKRLHNEDTTCYSQTLKQSIQLTDHTLVLLEGGSTLDEGILLNLSLVEISEVLEAPVLLVARFKSALTTGVVLAAKQRLGKRLLGVFLNDIPPDQVETAQTVAKPFLESRGVPVLGILPRSGLLRSASVHELAHRLKAEVLCRPDRLDLMVESLTIGAMNVNAAIKYFSERRNMAVVTGGDRSDIQMAALESNTQCLILTGHIAPTQMVLTRAEELEVPILSVDLDTLTTVEIIEQALGQVRLQEPIKVHYMIQLMGEHFDTDRLVALLGLETALPAR